MNLTNFTQSGYTIYRNLINLDLTFDLYGSVVSLFDRFDPDFTELDRQRLLGQFSWLNPHLHFKCDQLRQNHPECFGAIYDSIQMSVHIQTLTLNAAVWKAASKLLKTPAENLAATGPMLRMDGPHDERNSLDWHQDSTYYLQNRSGVNGIVVWIPMHKVNAHNGSIVICKGSHKLGKLNVSSVKKSALTSEQFRISKDVTEKFQQVQVEADAGDVVMLSMDTIHRSGVNSSDGFRFVAGIRFHRMDTSDFLPGKIIFQPNQLIKEF